MARWKIGKRARQIGEFIISQSFDKDREQVRMFNHHIARAIGMDKGSVTDGISELVRCHVLHVEGPRNQARWFRWHSAGVLIEPESCGNAADEAAALAEIERLNEDGIGIDPSGQHTLPLVTTDELTVQELHAGSSLRAIEGASLKERVIQQLASGGKHVGTVPTSSRIEPKEDVGALPTSSRVEAGKHVGTVPTFDTRARTIGTNVTNDTNGFCERPFVPSAKKPAKAGNESGSCGSFSKSDEWTRAKKKYVRIDEAILRAIADFVGEENRGYWATVMMNDYRDIGQDACHEAFFCVQSLLECESIEGIENRSRYLFFLYKFERDRIIARQEETQAKSETRQTEKLEDAPDCATEKLRSFPAQNAA